MAWSLCTGHRIILKGMGEQLWLKPEATGWNVYFLGAHVGSSINLCGHTVKERKSSLDLPVARSILVFLIHLM